MNIETIVANMVEAYNLDGITEADIINIMLHKEGIDAMPMDDISLAIGSMVDARITKSKTGNFVPTFKLGLATCLAMMTKQNWKIQNEIIIDSEGAIVGYCVEKPNQMFDVTIDKSFLVLALVG